MEVIKIVFAQLARDIVAILSSCTEFVKLIRFNVIDNNTINKMDSSPRHTSQELLRKQSRCHPLFNIY